MFGPRLASGSWKDKFFPRAVDAGGKSQLREHRAQKWTRVCVCVCVCVLGGQGGGEGRSERPGAQRSGLNRSPTQEGSPERDLCREMGMRPGL